MIEDQIPRSLKQTHPKAQKVKKGVFLRQVNLLTDSKIRTFRLKQTIESEGKKTPTRSNTKTKTKNVKTKGTQENGRRRRSLQVDNFGD